MVGPQGMEEGEQGFPCAALNGLATVVAETEVDCLFSVEGVQYAVDGLGGERTVGGVSGNVCLVHL